MATYIHPGVTESLPGRPRTHFSHSARAPHSTELYPLLFTELRCDTVFLAAKLTRL